MQGPEDLLRHVCGPSLCFVRPGRTSQSGLVGNVVIRCSDEMPGNGRLAERLNRETKRVCSPNTSKQLDGWTGVAPRPFENDPLDPVTPDSRAGPVLAPFHSTIESCISAVLLWVVLGPTVVTLARLSPMPHRRNAVPSAPVRGHLNGFGAGHKKRTLQMRLLAYHIILALEALLHIPNAIYLGRRNVLDEKYGYVLSVHETEVQSFVPFTLPRLRVALVRSLLLSAHRLPLPLLLPVQVYQDLPLHQDRGQ